MWSRYSIVSIRNGLRAGWFGARILVQLKSFLLRNIHIISGPLEKAFDSVNYDILLSKLSYHGISGKAKSLLNLIFRMDIKVFSLLTHFLMKRNFKMEQNKMWGAEGLNFRPSAISIVH